MPKAFAYTQAAQPSVSTGEPAYAVYIYHYPENQMEGQNDWEMRTLTSDLKTALQDAQSLYKSCGYRRVEVKKRVHDSKSARTRDTIFKVFDCDSGKEIFKRRCALAVVFGAAAALAYAFIVH
ncbi:MAG: hypothetical protein H6860_06100 [Rhodospirillales bacterium]|nr:hypothetical protein [Alphaproteobacteria bacterium]MCB9981952.1 hypothetical protein [Rhodospirillales bacterium]